MNTNIYKRCKVCGNRASGFNFQALSCQSCKIFFYRHSEKIEKFKCKKSGNCQLNTTSGPKCKACRLRVCYQIGMQRKQKEIISIKSEASNESKQLLESLFTGNLLQQLFQMPVNIPQISKRYAHKLTDFEQFQISKVAQAMNNAFVDETKLPVVRSLKSLNDSLELVEIYTKMISVYCKEFAAYNSLSQADQFTVFKGFWWDVMMLRFVYMVDLEAGGFLAVSNHERSEAIFIKYNEKSFFSDTESTNDIVKEYFEYTRVLQKEMDRDETIYNLLSALLLFKLNNKLSCPEYIRYNSIFYSRLTLRYLENKYKNCGQADRKFSTLMKLLSNLNKMKDVERILYQTRLDQNRFPQLFIELYDLV